LLGSARRTRNWKCSSSSQKKSRPGCVLNDPRPKR